MNLPEFPLSLAYMRPDWQTVHSAWAEHLPAAFWLIEQLKPRSIVELGTHAGDSYAAFCQAVVALGLDQQDARAMAVDTWEGDDHSQHYGEEIYQQLAEHHDPLYGHFSTLNRCLFDEARAQMEDNSIDLLHIDGLHTYDAARHDVETWRSAMRPGGVVLFHDVSERKEGFGVWRVWEELTPDHPHLLLPHGHGLGILAMSDDVPDGLKDVLSTPGQTALSAAQQRLIDWLAALGRGCEARRLQLVAETEAARIQHDHDRLQHHYESLAQAHEALKADAAAVQHHAQAMEASLSWRVTKPLRALRKRSVAS